MPIEVKHGAGANVAGVAAGFAGGVGKANARQREQMLRLVQQMFLAAAERRSRERQYEETRGRDAFMQDRMRSNMLDRAALTADLAAQRDERTADRQASNLAAQWDYRSRAAEDRLQGNLLRDELNAGYRSRAANEAFDNRMQLGQITALEKNASALEEFGQRQLTPQGRAEFAKFSRELNAIRSQRSRLRPEQYAQLLNEWQGRVNSARLEGKVMKQPTADELFPQYSTTQNGQMFTMTTRNGQPDFRAVKPPVDQEVKRREAEQKQQDREIQTIIKDLTTEDLKTGRKVSPSEEEVVSELRKRQRIRQQLQGGPAGGGQAAGGGRTGGGGTPPPAGGSVLERAIQAARSGDERARQALRERGIQW